MQFQIISVADNFMPLLNDDGTLMTFDDGTTAAKAAADLTTKFGKKFQPRPIKSSGDEWKARETARFESGTYRHPLFADRDWFKSNPAVADHFVHVSTEKPSMVAFTETAEHGQADRQTRLRVGRYLQRFFPDLDPDTLRRECEMHSGAFEVDAVQFATTADEIVEVYTNGPHSCMAHSIGNFSCRGHHPSEVYAGPDLAVAFMRVGTDRVSARAVVWPSQRVYSTIYGSSALARKLTDMGYSRGYLDGARIRKIASGRAFVCPYIDGHTRVYIDGDYLVIGEKSGETHLQCQNTHGLTSELCECQNCGSHVDEENIITIRTGRNSYEEWCSYCYEDDSVYVEHAGEHAHPDIVVEVSGGSFVFEWVAERDYTRSDRDSVYYHNSDICEVNTNVGGTVVTENWSQDDAMEYAILCDFSSEYYHSDDTVTLASGEAWGFDVFDKHGFECPECGENYSNADKCEHDGKTMCSDCRDQKVDEQRELEDCINTLMHPMLGAAFYSTLILPPYTK